VDEFSKKGYVADEKKEKYLELVKSTDVFVLDELGKETEMNNMTKNDVCKLFEINILKRRSNKTTIILSNLPNGLAEIRNRYNPSIHSFMFQKYRELEFKGQDFRIGFGGVNNFFEGL
jgi:DNA replication protein DnaC